MAKRNFLLGIVGLLYAFWALFYSWTMQFFGGHRNRFSHGVVIGTVGRMIWFNIPVAVILGFVVSYFNWWNDWPYQTYMDVWLLPYLTAQFLAWNFSDAIHLFLDTPYFKKINGKEKK